jgi:hypothetical protein
VNLLKYIEIYNNIISLENIKYIYLDYCCGDIININYLDGTKIRITTKDNGAYGYIKEKYQEIKSYLIKE